MNRILAAVLLSAVIAVPAARAWEPETTQAGLAEQAALASGLHKRLESIGFSGGLYEQLTIPPADAPGLLDALKQLPPSQGGVPDARGRQPAVAWLVAGAELADTPVQAAANHFYDVQTHGGWVRPDLGVFAHLEARAREALGRAQLPEHGVPAPDWVVAKDNPFSLNQFLDKYSKAVTAPTAGERSRQMAAALIAAGAMLHVLGDLGAPARVRGDYAAMLQPLGGGPDDLGSRFERIAALAYGRLGVPAPSRVITRTHLRDYFTAAGVRDKKGVLQGQGLADEIATTFFSEHTLPAASSTFGTEPPRLARPLPKLPALLNLIAAVREDGATIRTPGGVCLARYTAEHDVVTWSLDDDCMLQQIGAILPEVSAYETGLLDFLFRGELTVTVTGGAISVTGKGLAAGEIEVLVEDDRGIRTSLGTTAASGGAAELAHVAAPATGARVVAMFRGVDTANEPIVAVGGASLASSAPATPPAGPQGLPQVQEQPGQQPAPPVQAPLGTGTQTPPPVLPPPAKPPAGP
jgi:hypothetical protein|nr:hypothetical protein [Kofleriaceae bacterium]